MKDNSYYRCIVSDLDGTLLGKGGVLSEYAKETLEELMQDGIWFVPASGRPLCSYPQDIIQLRGLRYGIMSNGAMLYDWEQEKVLWCSKVPAHLVDNLLPLLENYSVAFEISINGTAYADEAYYQNPTLFGTGEHLKEYVQSTRIPVSDMKDFMRKHREETDSVVILVKKEEKKEVFERLSAGLKGVYMTTSIPHLIEITSVQAGKHEAVKRLCELLQIQMEEVVAFGDARNDQEMLEAVGLGIAVSNGAEECKEVADRIIGNHEEDAVAKELRKMFRDN